MENSIVRERVFKYFCNVLYGSKLVSWSKNMVWRFTLCHIWQCFSNFISFDTFEDWYFWKSTSFNLVSLKKKSIWIVLFLCPSWGLHAARMTKNWKSSCFRDHLFLLALCLLFQNFSSCCSLNEEGIELLLCEIFYFSEVICVYLRGK